MISVTGWLTGLLLLVSMARAERLPIRTYTTADGLARDMITCIVQDAHGFMWFCTPEGLSRFDGYGFTNYRTEQGLASNEITDFLETKTGEHWVATTAGICRLDPERNGGKTFQCYRLPSVPIDLLDDGAGGVWCAAMDGLYHLSADRRSFDRAGPRLAGRWATSVWIDSSRTIWLGTSNGLDRYAPDGTITTFGIPEGLPNEYVMAVTGDRDGALWVGTRIGLARFDSPPRTGKHAEVRVYKTGDGLPSNRIESLFQSSDGTLWVGADEGLAEWTPCEAKRGGFDFRSYTVENGLTSRSVGSIAEDHDGNLWVGGVGAMKLARSGFTIFGEADGVVEPRSLAESRSGELCAFYIQNGSMCIARFDGRSFVAIHPAWPKDITYWGWGLGQTALQDEHGEWWIATGRGLARFSRVTRVDQLAGMRPKAFYTSRDGMVGNKVFHIFEDSRSDIWIGTSEGGGLSLWARNTGRIRPFSIADGLPEDATVTSFTEDRTGAVWMTFYHRALGVYRNGRFTLFRSADGMRGFLRSSFVDSAGRLWIGSTEGLIRADDPAADHPHFIRYSFTQGLSSDDVYAITEDLQGRIYAATGRGIDRFEVEPRGLTHMKHYTMADGTVPGELSGALRDATGALWFRTPLGISRFVPTTDRHRAAPPIVVTGLSVGGVPHPVSDLGESALSRLKLPESPLRIDFVGLGFAPGEALRYQYMLEGADRDWNGFTDQRSVLYGRLTPGSYRFRVRAVTRDGAYSPEPATVDFVVLPPVWRTWWFLSACVAAIVLFAYSLHQYRVRQILAVANVRTRIATDLHDDIGASLSQIAILSEVARTSNGNSNGNQTTLLSDIAGISRELVDSIGDIVWAINPEHDHVSNLVHRMRRFAMDLLDSRNIALQFRCSLTDDDLPMGANVRRQVYLIFKEAIHNIVRHSRASRVEVSLDRCRAGLCLRVSDDGRGFTPTCEHEGLGLANMRRRSRAIGANVEIQSAPGQGATMFLTVSLESGRTLSVLRGKSSSNFG